MSRTASPSCGKPYGLLCVCKVWGFPRSTFYLRRSAPDEPPKRPGPKGFHSDKEMLIHIRQVIAESPFTGEGYRKIWAQLRFRGIRTSKERTLRIMRENNMSALKRMGHAHGPKAHDGTIKTKQVDVMWGTDMTTSLTVGERNASVFFAVDPVRWNAWESMRQNGEHALKPRSRSGRECDMLSAVSARMWAWA